MSKSIWWISLRRLKAHEVNTTLRLFPKEERTWLKKSQLFTSIQNKALVSFGKLFGQVTLAYLIATSLRTGNSIALEIFNFSVSTPATYFLSVLAFGLLITSINFNHLTTAIQLKASLAGKILLHGFSINAFDAIAHDSEGALGIPEQNSRFLRSVLPVPETLSFLLLVSIGCLLVPLVAIGTYAGQELYDLAVEPDVRWYERMSSFLGLGILTTAFFNSLLFHIPLPMQRNKIGIRWGFLYCLAPHASDDEKFKRWLDETGNRRRH
ncbi:hypothetical protein [uncultured Tateyamaria sp.]|uniref:hypothetical protein n=1 Tax=uncultured Tateyamaria sp. TaxID=455651 RepID=UPI002631390D|nr:hypothetical protein [uncultured Tateyamaria sp.]